MIEISVSYKNFIRFRIDFRIGWPAKTGQVITVGLRSGFPDLQRRHRSAQQSARKCSKAENAGITATLLAAVSAWWLFLPPTHQFIPIEPANAVVARKASTSTITPK